MKTPLSRANERTANQKFLTLEVYHGGIPMTDARAHTLFNVWQYLSLNPRATVREVMYAMEWHSPCTAYNAIRALEKLGYVTKPCRKHGTRKVLVAATYLDTEQAVA